MWPNALDGDREVKSSTRHLTTDGGWDHRAVVVVGGNRHKPSSPTPATPRTTKEGAMDYDNRAHRMTDEELEEWNREPISFVRGLVIAAALSLVFWAAVVVVFVIF